MADGVVLDAVVIFRFRHELAQGGGVLYDLVEELAAVFGLVVDSGGKIEHEWTAGNTDDLVEQWIAQEIERGRLHYVDGELQRDVLKRLHVDFGLPRNSWDREYIKCANVTEVKYIISEDMDLHDPTKKAAPAAEREKILRDGSGALARFLKRSLGIRVGCVGNCRTDLGL